MTTEHRENRSLPIRTAVEPASLTLVYPYELRADAHVYFVKSVFRV